MIGSPDLQSIQNMDDDEKFDFKGVDIVVDETRNKNPKGRQIEDYIMIIKDFYFESNSLSGKGKLEWESC